MMGRKTLLSAAVVLLLCLAAGFAAGCQPQGGPASDAEGERWPGQSLGYVGPNGEGALDYGEYGSRDEYLEAIADSMAKQAETGAQWVEDDAGRKFLQGTVCVYFKRDAGEARCREIAEELGGLWVDDSFAVPAGVDFADATVFFSSLSDEPYESLEAVCGRLEAFDEVLFAEPLVDAGIRTD